MYIAQNDVVSNVFNIIDTVRRYCCGKKYYIVPRKNTVSEILFKN